MHPKKPLVWNAKSLERINSKYYNIRGRYFKERKIIFVIYKSNMNYGIKM